MAPSTTARRGAQPETPPFTIPLKSKSRTSNSRFARCLDGTSLVCEGMKRYLAVGPIRDQTASQASHARYSGHHPTCFGALYLSAGRLGDPVMADRLQCCEHPQPVC